jgi:predicted enzyme related to lactoylglutathione lyase
VHNGVIVYANGKKERVEDQTIRLASGRTVGFADYGIADRRLTPRSHSSHHSAQHNRKAQIMSSTVFAVSFDAHDAQAVASFWAAVLGRTVADGANGDNAAINADPAVPGSRISFHSVPEGKTVKNRMHFDLITTDFDAEVDRLIGLGATKLNEINAGSHWATLADPEGNEFDVIAG